MSELLPHHLRVVEEKNELDKKIVALNKFISSANEVFMLLEHEERFLLRRQLSWMVRYSSTLGERIAYFGGV